jgi:hypothetical protein
VRIDAQDADLPRRIDDRGRPALSAASAAASSAATADGELSGRIDGPGRRDLSDPAAATTAATARAPVRRTRLNLHGRRFRAPAVSFWRAEARLVRDASVHRSLRPHCY